MKKLFYCAFVILFTFFLNIKTSAQSANRSLSNLIAPTKINADLLPDKNDLRSFGAMGIAWHSLYLKGGIFFDNQKFISNAGTQNTLLGINAGKSITTGAVNSANGYQALYSNTTGSYNMATGGFSMYENTAGNYNAAYGSFSLNFNTTGSYNIANGYTALYHNTTGNYNTAIGHEAMYINSTGSKNTAIGSYTLFYNLTGNDNTAIGYYALENNNTAYSNVAIGTHALYKNSAVANLVAIGDSAMYNQTGGTANTAIGSKAMYSNTSGGANTAIGFNASYYNTTGVWNTSVGVNALADNTTGSYSTAMGVDALVNNNGSENNAFGGNALGTNTSGVENTAMGNGSLYRNNIGNYNTAFGYATLYNNTSSQFNTALGFAAGYNFDNGYNNVFVGAQTDVNQGGLFNVVAVGHATICTASSQARIGNSSTTSIGGWANWSNVSDVRVKKNIKQNVPGLAFINKLQPITYNLDLEAADRIIQPTVTKDKDGKILQPSQQDLDVRKAKEQVVYTGFAAQDVEKAAKSLNYDFSGVDVAKNDKDLYGLRYSDFVVPLVKAVQELSQENDELKQRIEKLESMMNASGQSAVNSEQLAVVSSASLLQNVPNPFNHTTTINYVLPKAFSSAKIIITGNAGRIIKEIGISGAGKGSLQIDASTLSSGTYQYSLIIDGRSIASKQMILTK